MSQSPHGVMSRNKSMDAIQHPTVQRIPEAKKGLSLCVSHGKVQTSAMDQTKALRLDLKSSRDGGYEGTCLSGPLLGGEAEGSRV